MINQKAKSTPLRMLTTVETVISVLPFRLVLALVVACLLILGSFKPAASDRRGGDEGSGVGGTGILDLPGTGLGGSGLRPFLGIASPQGSPQEIASAESAVDGPSRASSDEIVVLHERYFPLATASLESTIAPTPSPAHSALVNPSLENPSFESSAPVSATLESSTLVSSTLVRVLKSGPLSVNAIAHPVNLSQVPTIEGFVGTATTSLAIDDQHRSAGSLSITESIEYSTQDNNSVLALSAIALADTAFEDPTESGKRAEPLVWKDIANWLNASAAKAAKTDAAAAKELNNETSDNLAIAEMARATGIRRPQLPPLQRARPLQRAAILPPRVRPLGL
jgi:hypothetical protein